MPDVTIHLGRRQARTVTLPAGLSLARLLDEILDRVSDRRGNPSSAFSFWRRVGGVPAQVDEAGLTVADMAGWTPPNEIWILCTSRQLGEDA